MLTNIRTCDDVRQSFYDAEGKYNVACGWFDHFAFACEIAALPPGTNSDDWLRDYYEVRPTVEMQEWVQAATEDNIRFVFECCIYQETISGDFPASGTFTLFLDSMCIHKCRLFDDIVLGYLSAARVPLLEIAKSMIDTCVEVRHAPEAEGILEALREKCIGGDREYVAMSLSTLRAYLSGNVE